MDQGDPDAPELSRTGAVPGSVVPGAVSPPEGAAGITVVATGGSVAAHTVRELHHHQHEHAAPRPQARWPYKAGLVVLLTLVISGTLYLVFRDDKDRSYAKEVGFYHTGDQAAVANGSTHFMPMRLVLASKHVWWDLLGPEPCKQVWIPFDSLIGTMHEKLPDLSLSRSDLADLQLKFQDPAGQAWSIDRTGALTATTWTATGEGGTQLDRSDLLVHRDEPWMTDAQVSPGCGPV